MKTKFQPFLTNLGKLIQILTQTVFWKSHPTLFKLYFQENFRLSLIFVNRRHWMDFPKIDFELNLIGSYKIVKDTLSRNLSSQSGLSTTDPNFHENTIEN